jgi:hypothetical protein
MKWKDKYILRVVAMMTFYSLKEIRLPNVAYFSNPYGCGQT